MGSLSSSSTGKNCSLFNNCLSAVWISGQAGKRAAVDSFTIPVSLVESINGESCRKYHFVESKHVFCRNKSMLVSTNLFLSRQIFVSTNMCLSRQK